MLPVLYTKKIIIGYALYNIDLNGILILMRIHSLNTERQAWELKSPTGEFNSMYCCLCEYIKYILTSRLRDDVAFSNV